MPPSLTSVGTRGSSGKAPMVDFSSPFDEGDLITDVSQDEEFARRLFGDLNRDFLGPSKNGKIIILSDSNEEEELLEEKVAHAEAVPSSSVRSPTSTTSTDDTNGTYKSNTPDWTTDGCSSGGDEADLP
jgi:hypothetical protein